MASEIFSYALLWNVIMLHISQFGASDNLGGRFHSALNVAASSVDKIEPKLAMICKLLQAVVGDSGLEPLTPCV